MRVGLLAIMCLQAPILTLAALVKNLVVFGDVNSDVENSQNKSSNGPLWSEYVTVGWNASLHNFARSGAVCDNDIYKTISAKTKVPSIKDQIEAFYNLNLNLKAEETVFALWIGLQDITEMAKRRSNPEPDIKEIKNCIGQQVRAIRKVFDSAQFLLFNVPPIGYMPSYSESDSTLNKSHAAIEINRFLEKDSANLNKHHHGLNMDYVDIYALLMDMNVDPTLFDFKYSKLPYLDQCPGDDCSIEADDYVWWDKTHFTTAFHRSIANSILQAGSYMPTTYSNSTEYVQKLLNEPKSKFKSKKYTIKPNSGIVDEAVKEIDLELQTIPSNMTQQSVLEDDIESGEPSGTSFNTDYNMTILIVVVILIGIVGYIGLSKSNCSFQTIFYFIESRGKGKFVPVHTEEEAL
ncbi:carbohydrate esterase family 16 protein [Backusella circina FSU 941]|nr:carbohydrate esterase family 16 protein [Backusella circina FSU 941]